MEHREYKSINKSVRKKETQSIRKLKDCMLQFIGGLSQA